MRLRCISHICGNSGVITLHVQGSFLHDLIHAVSHPQIHCFQSAKWKAQLPTTFANQVEVSSQAWTHACMYCHWYYFVIAAIFHFGVDVTAFIFMLDQILGNSRIFLAIPAQERSSFLTPLRTISQPKNYKMKCEYETVVCKRVTVELIMNFLPLISTHKAKFRMFLKWEIVSTHHENYGTQ